MRPKADAPEIGKLNPTWSLCGEETRSALLEQGELLELEPGQVLYRDGDDAAVAMLPMRGQLECSKTAARGRRQVLCHVDSQMCAGMCMLLMADRSVADIVAAEPSAVLVVPRSAMMELATRNELLGSHAWRAVGSCLTHFVNIVESLSFRKVSERVVLALLDSTTPECGVLRRTQSELAAEVGTTREVVARCLAELQQLGVIRLGRGRVMVLDRSGLERAR